MSTRVRVALAALSGVMAGASFYESCWPLAVVAWVPLLAAVDAAAPARAGLLSWIAGIMMVVIGMKWLPDAFMGFSGASALTTTLAYAALSAYQGLRVGVAGLLYARLVRSCGLRSLSFVLSVTAAESFIPLPLPWFLGGTVAQWTLLIQCADLAGPTTVTAAVVAVNCALFFGIHAMVRRTFVYGRREVLVPAALVLGAIAYGAHRVPIIEGQIAGGRQLKVGIVQANMAADEKHTRPREGLLRHIEITRALIAEQHPDLAVWSETAVVHAVPERFAQRFYDDHFLGHLSTPLLFGAALVVEGAQQQQFLNSAWLANAQGHLVGRYDKRHLMLGGEEVPFADLIPWSDSLPGALRFVPGDRSEPLQLGDIGLGVAICLEDLIPEAFRQVLLAGPAQLLINLTNDGWFRDDAALKSHLAQARLRAVENRRYLVRATNTGSSAIIDPVGRIVRQAPNQERHGFVGRVTLLDLETSFQRTGSLPWTLLSVLTVATAWLSTRRASAFGRNATESLWRNLLK